MTTPQLTSRLRGGGCGVLVGALAVAAHGLAGGGVPRSAEIMLLLLVSLAAGGFAAGGTTTRRPRSRGVADSRRLGSRTDTVDSWNGRRGSSRTPRAAAVSAGTALWRTLSRTLRAPVGRADTVRAATALLGGQWAGHYALTGTLDHHGGVLDVPHLPNGPMVVAHLLAAIACAALILAAERLYLVASGVIRSVLTAPAPATRRPATRWPTTFGQALGTRRDPARSPRAPPLFV